jgi:hypothetical protein
MSPLYLLTLAAAAGVVVYFLAVGPNTGGRGNFGDPIPARTSSPTRPWSAVTSLLAVLGTTLFFGVLIALATR